MTQPHPDFNQQIEIYNNEIIAHCYRMMGSIQEAEDLAQETFLKAWKNFSQFDQRSSIKTWLYKIATNACIDALRKHKRRQLILDEVAPMPGTIPDKFVAADDISWLEPFPDTLLPSASANPEAVFTQQESISLAFMIALQNLPHRQRAVLLLRDVLNWRSKEVAEYLDMTELAVSSALNRARKKLEEVQAEHAHKPDEAKLTALLHRYVEAWQNADIDELILVIKDDAIMTMPPLSAWYQGVEDILSFFKETSFHKIYGGDWKLIPTAFNNQPAFEMHVKPRNQEEYQLFGVNVLGIQGDKIARIHAFLISSNHLPLANTQNWLDYIEK